MMPLETVGDTRINEKADKLGVGDQYSMTITPAADWYAFYLQPTAGGTPEIINGDKGQPLTYTAVTTKSDNVINLDGIIGAVPALPATQEDTVAVSIHVYKQSQQD